MLEQLDQELGIAKAPKVTVNPAANSELMQITPEHPALTALGANALADLLVSDVRNSQIANDQSAEQHLNRQVTQSEIELNEARHVPGTSQRARVRCETAAISDPVAGLDVHLVGDSVCSHRPCALTVALEAWMTIRLGMARHRGVCLLSL